MIKIKIHNQFYDRNELTFRGLHFAKNVLRDFSIELTSDAFVAEYHTSDNETSLIVVNGISNSLEYIATINGDYENKTVREFVDTQLLARDARELRKHIEKIQPNVDLYHEYEDNRGNIIKKDIPVGISFFWPDASV